jgi:hypothetical protein
MGGFQSWSGRCGEGKNLLSLPGIEPQYYADWTIPALYIKAVQTSNCGFRGSDSSYVVIVPTLWSELRPLER